MSEAETIGFTAGDLGYSVRGYSGPMPVEYPTASLNELFTPSERLDHTIRAQHTQIQERLLSTLYAKLHDNGVLLEGSLLKPSMTVPGVDCKDRSDPATIAKMTVQTLDRSLPAA